jgi:hypothetical protein
MNDSDLSVNGSRSPEVPVMDAGVGGRNWWPLLSLLMIPLVFILACVIFLYRKR